MTKWFGKIGFSETAEVSPGIWEDVATERNYYGEILRGRKRVRGGEKLTDDVEISNEVSVLADPFVMDHLRSIRYIVFMGAKWKISEVDLQYPRLILTLGGLYNG